MDFQGWGEALEACLQKRNNNIENEKKNTPGLRFLFFFKTTDAMEDHPDGDYINI